MSECPEAEEVSEEKKTFIEEVYTRILLSFFLEWIDEGMQDETQVQLEDYFYTGRRQYEQRTIAV